MKLSKNFSPLSAINKQITVQLSKKREGSKELQNLNTSIQKLRSVEKKAFTLQQKLTFSIDISSVPEEKVNEISNTFKKAYNLSKGYIETL